MFALGNLCGVKPTDNLRLADFFQLILGVDQYIKDNANSG
jgi:hypothetical protein